MPQVSLAPPPLCSAPPPLLAGLLPSLPPTVGDAEVPPSFRRRFVLSGYRPVGQAWRRCVLSLLQVHNESVNVWIHLLAAAGLLTRFLVFAVLQGGGVLGVRLQGPEGQGPSVDASSLPLVVHFLSAVTYLSCSAAAHLLMSRSEEARRSLFLLERVAAAAHQYGRAAALWVYSADAAWTQGALGQVYLPAAALLTWGSCASRCRARPRPPGRALLVGVACAWEVAPVARRLAARRWSNGAAPLHLLQVALLLLSRLFRSLPGPERFFPGRCDIVGQGHQALHLLQALGALGQQEALFRDFLWRRPALGRLLGEERLLLAGASPAGLAACCAVTTFTMRGRHRAEENTTVDEGGRE